VREHTVEKHVGAILGKLGLPSRLALLALALRERLEVPPPARP
jgi:DNA-binding CsgD family transcriptional regulator